MILKIPIKGGTDNWPRDVCCFLTLGEKLDLNSFATELNWMQIKGLKFDLIRRNFEGIRYLFVDLRETAT